MQDLLCISGGFLIFESVFKSGSTQITTEESSFSFFLSSILLVVSSLDYITACGGANSLF